MLFSLQKITVENFRGVRRRIVMDLSLTPSGLYFIRGINREDARLGSNGAGKSTLFSEAIIWALTGRISRAARPGNTVENRQSSGTTSVSIEFLLDRTAHVVERTRNPNNLSLDGSKVEEQDIVRVLPLTDAALRKSVLIDQFGEMFLSLRPEAKSQLFTEALDLDMWLRAADEAGQQADKAKRERDGLANKQTGMASLIDAVYDQYERALEGEKEFEESIKKQIADAKQQAAAAKKEVYLREQELNIARANCPDEGDRARQLNDYRTQARRQQFNVSEARSRGLRLDRELDEISDRLAAYKGTVCPECGQSVTDEHLKERRAELRGRITILEDGQKTNTTDILKAGLELEKTEKSIAKLEAQLVEFSKRMADTAVAAERSQNALREMHRANNSLKALQDQSNPFTKQVDDLEVKLKELKAQAKRLIAEEQVVSTSLAIYEFWVKGFREIRLQQIDAALTELELATNRHAEALGLEGWRIAFATDRETKRGTVSYGFNVLLYPSDSDEDPVSWDTYCGGEVQRWQLATTFGLSEVLLARAGITTDFEVLDEPSQHLSPEGIDDLLVCLSDRARDLNRRIFLIDHGSLSAGSFDGVVTICKTSERGTYIEDTGGVLQVVMPRRERAVL